VCWGLDDPLQHWKIFFHKGHRMQGKTKMPVPVGINEDTDASVEPRQGGSPLSCWLHYQEITSRKKQIQKGNPKQKAVQSRSKNPKPNPN